MQQCDKDMVYMAKTFKLREENLSRLRRWEAGAATGPALDGSGARA